MTLEQFNTAVRPKVHGALNLHNATVSADADLDFFFMTSSTVTYVGHISQSNYAASNAVLDNLARKRIAMGLPAATISLGPIKGVGTLNRNPEYAENLLRSGLIEAPESEFIRHFERFTHGQPASARFDSLTQGHILTGVEYSKHDLSMVQVTRIEQDRRSALLVTTLESRLVALGSGGAVAELGSDDTSLLDIPDDREKAVIVLADAVARRLAKLMFLAVEDIEINKPLSHFGIDSMSGSEMIHWLSQKFSVGVSFLELLAPSCTSKSLAGTIFDTLQANKAAAATTISAPAPAVVNGKSNGGPSQATGMSNGTHETPNGTQDQPNRVHKETNSKNGTQTTTESNGISDASPMEEFSRAVYRAIADPKPVMHSYVCTAVNSNGQLGLVHPTHVWWREISN